MRRILTLVAVALVWALPATVSAASPGASVQAGQAIVVNKVFVSIPVTLSCQPMTLAKGEEGWWEDAFVYVGFQQAIGHRHATAEGWYDFDARVTCDGKPHTVVVTADAGSSATLVKSGRALMRVYIDASYERWSDEDEDTVVQVADTGWVRVRLHK